MASGGTPGREDVMERREICVVLRGSSIVVIEVVLSGGATRNKIAILGDIVEIIDPPTNVGDKDFGLL